MPKLIIGADIVPTNSNEIFFKSGNMEEIVDENLLDLLKTVDYRIFNLEVPLTDMETPISKAGPNLIAPLAAIEGIKALGVNFVTLANNHIMDQGEQGLVSTIEVLNKAAISHAGAGSDLEDAIKPYIVHLAGVSFGIYCCTEHEFSVADEELPGANPFEPLESFDHIVKLRQMCDYVICLYHGGKEHYRYPSPYLQKVCRKLVEKGCDLVVCQHSHCIGCEEKWGNGRIVYGQGNFLFDNSESEYWQTSVLIDLSVNDDLEMKINYIPIEKHNQGVQLAKRTTKEQILKEFFERSKEIELYPESIAEHYTSFAADYSKQYLYIASAGNHRSWLRILNGLFGNVWEKYFNRVFGRRESLSLKNIIECEAHRELFLEVLNRKIKEK